MKKKEFTLRRYPKTAWDALDNTCEVILNEPRSYYQNIWALDGAKTIFDFVRKNFGMPEKQVAPTLLVEPEDLERRNVCNTMCCVAGHVVYQLGQEEGKVDMEFMSTAMRLLGTPDIMARSVFQADMRNLFGSSYPHNFEPPLKIGSPEYAEWGVSRIREFMTKHETRLRATRYTYVGRGGSKRLVMVKNDQGVEVTV